MTASNEWWEYHLTPRGWEMGSFKIDSSPVQRKDPPLDRVLTIKHRETIASSFSKLHTAWEEEWRSLDLEKVNTLIRCYGASPRKQ